MKDLCFLMNLRINQQAFQYHPNVEDNHLDLNSNFIKRHGYFCNFNLYILFAMGVSLSKNYCFKENFAF